MKLRRLKVKDAPFMLEWMRDGEVTRFLLTKFNKKTLHDCIEFIKYSQKSISDIHYAVVSDNDEYMGTVSLKNIDRKKKRAEFAIAIRKTAMGCGYSWFGMSEIIKIGFNQEGLESIYWCVSKKNERACRFYEKHLFNEMLDVDNEMLKPYLNINDLKWYIVKKDDDFLNVNNFNGKLFKIVSIKTIGTEKSGQLSFIESSRNIPFEIKRIYYISKVHEGVRRGFHAHKKLKQLLFCPFGKINLVFDNGKEREEILLDNPSVGVLIENPLWREMVWIENNSILCVLASDYYDESDYIRNYDDFLKYIIDNK